MQAGVVVANQNKLPFREEDNAFDYQWDNHNILTCRWQSSPHYHQPVMGMICRLIADKLSLKFTHLSYRNYLQQDCQSAKQEWGLYLTITGPKYAWICFGWFFHLLFCSYCGWGYMQAVSLGQSSHPPCKERSKLQHITWSTLMTLYFALEVWQHQRHGKESEVCNSIHH
jgi:hypothetical protein